MACGVNPPVAPKCLKTLSIRLISKYIRYKQNPQSETPQPDPSGAEPSSDKKDEKVVDADFEEVDENKKD